MNLFLITKNGELLTPGLGTILQGVTRDSILTLASDHGLTPVQRRIHLDELQAGLKSGEIVEAFAAGTAAVVTPIIAFAADGFDIPVGSGAPGTLTLAFREHLLGIQYGTREDTHGWTRQVVPAAVSV